MAIRKGERRNVLADSVSVVTDLGAVSFGSDVEKKCFSAIISGEATLLTQVSIDGVNWHTARTSQATDGFTINEPWPFVRPSVTVASDATVSLYVAT